MLTFSFRAGFWDPLVEQWRDNLGVEVRWRGMTWAEYLGSTQSAQPSIYFMGWLGDYPDPDNYLRVAPQNIDWRDQEYTETIEQARRTLDQRKRIELYAHAQRILAAEVPVLPLSYDRIQFLVKPWVKRYPISALGSAFWKDVVLEPH
jgi:oligopeptide transport system substrate-binding protein